MLNAYPDSLGGNLGDIVTLLKTEAMQDVFSSFYILPSLYHSDLDRGFSVIDYDLNEQLANRKDLEQLKDMGIDLKLDFILNHASAQSPQFQDLVEKGEASAYRDFFIDWNRFWEGHGTMTEEGYIQPDESCLKQMFFRNQTEGEVFGVGCKIFTIAGPVILYGIVSSWFVGLIYWIMHM